MHAVGACPQDGSCVVGLLFNWRRHTLSLPKFTSSPHNGLPTNRSCCLHIVFFFRRRRRHPQDIPPSNKTGLSDSGSRNDSVKPSPNADNVLVHRRLDSLSLSLSIDGLARKIELGFTRFATRLSLRWPCRPNVSNNRVREREREGGREREMRM